MYTTEEFNYQRQWAADESAEDEQLLEDFQLYGFAGEQCLGSKDDSSVLSSALPSIWYPVFYVKTASFKQI